jgi:hypothetical protein
MPLVTTLATTIVIGGLTIAYLANRGPHVANDEPLEEWAVIDKDRAIMTALIFLHEKNE